MTKGIETSAACLRANFPIEKPVREANELAQECVKFLKAAEVWDRVMQDANSFNARTEQADPLLKSGMHKLNAQVWKTLPPNGEQ